MISTIESKRERSHVTKVDSYICTHLNFYRHPKTLHEESRILKCETSNPQLKLSPPRTPTRKPTITSVHLLQAITNQARFSSYPRRALPEPKIRRSELQQVLNLETIAKLTLGGAQVLSAQSSYLSNQLFRFTALNHDEEVSDQGKPT